MRWRAVLAGLAGTAIATAALAWILVSRGDELQASLDRLPLSVFALATLLHGLVLVVRAEAWGVTLAATRGRAAPHRVLHTACAAGYLVGSVEIHVALPVRMAVMRRLAPGDTPGLRGMVLSDMPLFWLEVLIGCVVGPVAALAVPRLPWWVAPLALLVAAAVTIGLRLGHQRFAHRRLAGGLAVLGTPGRRVALTVLALAIAAFTIARIALLTHACGLAAGVPEIALLYLAIGAGGLLPIGPASVPGATLVVAGGAAGVGPAGAVGLAIAASTIAAVVVYAAAMALLTSWRALRQPSSPDEHRMRHQPSHGPSASGSMPRS